MVQSYDAKKQRAKASKALSNARQRCTNTNDKEYKNYGALGIKVLLNSVDELIACIGLPKLHESLDRIDPNGHYEPGNVRWATKAVQAANKKTSTGGSTVPLHTLVAQQKIVVELENQRPKATEAWHLMLSAFNRGGISCSEQAQVQKLLQLKCSALEAFGSRAVLVSGTSQVVFRMPSLTCPDRHVEARGPLRKTPEGKYAELWTRNGLLYGLGGVHSSANVPSQVRGAIETLRKDDTQTGLTLAGRPAEDDLAGGWFEIWMLAAASALVGIGVAAGLFPAMTCLGLLKQFGGPSQWDHVCHPLLDASLVFIPDFQLDCGPWGYVSPYDFGMLHQLLKYRAESGHKTVVGVQAPHQLSQPLKKILLGRFRVEMIANGSVPPVLQSSLPTASKLQFGTVVAEPA